MGCIYMYKNIINGMRYIGQTRRPLHKRHIQHLSQDSYIDKAIRKYGEDNFELTILEDDINDPEQLNYLERFYIEFYDTCKNGYNLAFGGNGGATLDPEVVLKIEEELKTSRLSMKEIGEKYGFSIYTVSDINNGYTAASKLSGYPIRKYRCTQLFSEADIEIVENMLINTEYSFMKIAEMSDTNFYFVVDVNNGKRKSRNSKNHEFPIRTNPKKEPVTFEQAEAVINCLLKEDLSADEIGAKLGLHGYTVGQINRGKADICKQFDIDYPVRKRQHRNKKTPQELFRKLTDNDIKEIISELIFTDLSIEEIAKRRSVSRASIDRINQGKVWKDILSKYKIPLRGNKQDNSKIINSPE